jgi:hypothetical protein
LSAVASGDDERRKTQALDVSGAPAGASVTGIALAERLRQRVVIRAEKAQIFGTVIACVAIDVVDVERYPARARVSFAPPTNAALLVVQFHQIAANMNRRLVEARRRSFDLSVQPILDNLG